MRQQKPPYKKIAGLLASIANPARVQILLAIGIGEACVCHLESLLGLRQAYISQQLMLLRKKKIITSRREGKYIFYHLVNPKILGLIQSAGEVLGVTKGLLDVQDHSNCQCPKCNLDSDVISSNLPVSGHA